MPEKSDVIHNIIDKPERFQQLTDEDKAIYQSPELIYLNLPASDDAECELKRSNWLYRRAASYSADRHSEYLFCSPGDLADKGPRILISAVLDPNIGVDAYLSLFSKKRRYQIKGQKATNLGYKSSPVSPESYSYEIYEIIHSKNMRQGRGVDIQFLDRGKEYDFPEYRNYADPFYKDICMGVFSPDNLLVAYLLGKRAGDHVQYDEIMGHADHLHNDVMYLLHYSFLKECLNQNMVPKCLNYGPWYSGMDPYSPQSGLNFWKRKVKFRPAYLIYEERNQNN